MNHPTVLHRWFEEVWNQGSESAIDELLTSDCIIHNLDQSGADSLGPRGFKPFLRMMRAAFPDLQVTVEDTVEQDGRIAARWSARMTHHGDHLGIPATGRSVEITGMSFGLLSNGKIKEAWNNWDAQTLFERVGLLPKITIRGEQPE